MTIQDLALPDIPGYTVRHYLGEVDLPAIVGVLSADEIANNRESNITLEQMRWFYAHLINCDPARDMLLVEGPSGLVAYGRAAWYVERGGQVYLYPLAVHVRPEVRRQGLSRALLAWLEARAVAIAAEQAHPRPPAVQAFWQADCSEVETAKTAALERAGYTPARYSYHMVRPDLENIPDVRLPPGVELRPALPEHYRTIWDAMVEAFQDHWGAADPTEENYAAWLSNTGWFQPEIWKVAWEVASNQVVGMVLGFIDTTENEKFNRRRGYTENISVRRPWRRQGVARALIAENLRELKARGMTEAALGVDTENLTGALSVYEAMGFRPVHRSITYRKPFPE
jgi:mycothiol synthase